MKQHYRYHFEVTHDYGSFFTSVVSYNKRNAIEMVCKAEDCPKRAVEFIRKEPITL